MDWLVTHLKEITLLLVAIIGLITAIIKGRKGEKSEPPPHKPQVKAENDGSIGGDQITGNDVKVDKSTNTTNNVDGDQITGRQVTVDKSTHIHLPPQAEAQKSGYPWNVPFAPNPNFTGRDAEMEQLQNMLHSGRQAVISQAISGMGGVGKTQLAVEYAHKYKSDYPGGVLWVRCAEDVLGEYGQLDTLLGLKLPDNLALEKRCLTIQQCLQGRAEQTLLTLDNLKGRKR